MLKQRSTEIEIMDDLAISGDVIDQTLRELDTINRFLGGNQISLHMFKKMARGREIIRLADLGCGGGDILKDMARWCRKNNIEAELIGYDANPHIIEYAKKHTEDFPEIQYVCADILGKEFRKETFDIVHCCLFAHHFDDDTLTQLFRQVKDQTSMGVIVNDLHRHSIAYWSIKLLTGLFSRSYMVRNDAAVSVARSFTRNELHSILTNAGIADYRIRWRWAFRWELSF